MSHLTGEWNKPSPMQMGAQIGDPSTHLAAIQKAINLYGGVHIPVDTHWFIDGEILVARDDVTVCGEGWSSRIQQTAPNMEVFRVTGNGFKITGVHGIGEGSDLGGGVLGGNFVLCLNNRAVEITHNITEGFSAASYQFRNVKGIQVTNNLAFGAQNTGGPSSDILTWGGCKNVVISNNLVFSDVSQNIYVGALAGDENITITGNVCDTLDANFDPVAAPTVKRHGIVASYFGAPNEQNAFVVANNICRNTNWTGIYSQGNADTIIIKGNMCFDNGKENPGNSLGGGIQLSTDARRNIVQGNFIYRFGMTVQGVGGITVNGGGDQNLIHDNVIVDSQTYGIQLGLNGTYYSIQGNYIANPVDRALNVTANPNVNAEGLVVGNTIQMSTTEVAAIFFNPQGANNPWQIHSNRIIGGGAGVTAQSRGIYAQSHNVDIQNNVISGFRFGISQVLPYTNRNTLSRYKDNSIRDCTFSYDLPGAGLVVVEGGHEDNVGTSFVAGAGRYGTITNGLFEILSAGAPGPSPNFLPGDIARNTTIAVGQPIQYGYDGAAWLPGPTY